MRVQAVAAEVWGQRRQRAADLAGRWPFAAEVLGFYGAVLEAQADIYARARRGAQRAASLTRYIAEAGVPSIRRVAVSRGPARLARAVEAALPGAGIDVSRWAETVGGWLSNDALSPVDRFLTRAAAEPVLRALERPARPDAADASGRRCPQCGGPPQLALLAPAGEDLVAPRRLLECARCAARWPYARMTCPGCGEGEADRLPVFSEEGVHGGPDGALVRGLSGPHGSSGASSGPRACAPPARPAPGAPEAAGARPRFPHLAVCGCRTCGAYLLCIDMGRDGAAVPVVDEMAALPLDLYAREQGLRKIVPNLMGL